MSASMLGSAWPLVAHLGVLLSSVDPKRRPSIERAALVHLRLADAYRDGRGYVDETVGQVAAVVGFDPRSCLAALEVADVWVTAAREAVTRIAASTIEFTTDDVWGLVPPVDEPRAMGPIMVWAAEHRLVEPTDRTVPSIRPEAHARPVRVWRSRTYRPPSMF